MEQSRKEPVYPPPQAIHHELRNAENSAGHVMAKLHSMREINPHLAILDVGAGSGTISVTLAKAITDGHVTAIDLNPEILPRARAIAEISGINNIEFQQGDAYKLPFADETFDITYCHQMLTHLKAPQDALREMLRVTKPRGIVAAREGDLETECVWPELPGVLKFHKFAADMMSAAGGTPIGGRQLLPWALKAGVKRDQITVSYGTWSFSTPREKETWAQAMAERVRGGRLREGGLKSGLTTENDLEEMATDWEKWAQRDDASLAMMQGEVLIQK
ncbi:S-adenosyl-L-methionine-dependent methyltransferase [Rhizodiscina lignyota]|uniref:S-adenosyl-L-methionine-dependent methyltransferase n=1 Tax=Rhizodiscina lignyota TaxID=1504668 RepID=A0A9P4ITI0_9PEZI|nr:S-adenosyl-L-methionine-dependent methyltransferase [Rhizodiscina lignyota]